MTERALFIPLKTGPFEEFARCEKTTEYRLYGPRWNEKTCRVGRAVILSKGYGKKHRLRGRISHFFTMGAATIPGWREHYPNGSNQVAACIRIEVTR